MAKDYYSILGVTKESSQEEVKKAYRRLAHQYHPDKGNGDDKKFKELNEAYQILGDPTRRAQYDRFGAAFSGDGGPGPGFDFSQFSQGFGGGQFEVNIEDLFGDFFSAGQKGRKRARRGGDIVIDVEITLDEAFRGTVKEIEVRKFAVCEHCKGEGAEPGTKKKKCETCDGTGETRQAHRTFFGMMQQVRTCSTCNGEGEYPETRCKECGGDGRVRQVERLSIPIPAGVDESSVIKISGKGEAATRGGVAGDLLVRISVKEHLVLERDGAELYSTVNVSFPQAVLGDTITIDTIEGRQDMSIPKGVQSGTPIVLKGKGMPTGRGSRGNHIVRVHVETPEKISKKARQLIEDLKEELE